MVKKQIREEKKTKICYKCKIEKPIEEFYINRQNTTDGRFGQCIPCEREKQKKYKDKTEGGGHKRIADMPGVYKDDLQEEYTSIVMNICGWKYNPENKIWYKPPTKDKNGNWTFKKRKVKAKENYVPQREIYEMKKKKLATPPKDYVPKEMRQTRRTLSPEIQEEIRMKYQEPGMTQIKLAFIYDVAQSYINYILHYQR